MFWSTCYEVSIEFFVCLLLLIFDFLFVICLGFLVLIFSCFFQFGEWGSWRILCGEFYKTFQFNWFTEYTWLTFDGKLYEAFQFQLVY